MLISCARLMARQGATVFGTDLGFVWPFTYQMNFTVQKELFRSTSVSAP